MDKYYKIIVELKSGEEKVYLTGIEYDCLDHHMEEARGAYPDCEVWSEDDWM